MPAMFRKTIVAAGNARADMLKINCVAVILFLCLFNTAGIWICTQIGFSLHRADLKRVFGSVISAMCCTAMP